MAKQNSRSSDMITVNEVTNLMCYLYSCPKNAVMNISIEHNNTILLYYKNVFFSPM